MRKGGNAGNQHLLIFPQCFSTLPEANFSFWAKFTLLSANTFNSYQSKILLFGKELNERSDLFDKCSQKQWIETLYETGTKWKDLLTTKEWNWKLIILGGRGTEHCGKRIKCWLPAFYPFPTAFSNGFFPNVTRFLVKSFKEFTEYTLLWVPVITSIFLLFLKWFLKACSVWSKC